MKNEGGGEESRPLEGQNSRLRHASSTCLGLPGLTRGSVCSHATVRRCASSLGSPLSRTAGRDCRRAPRSPAQVQGGERENHAQPWECPGSRKCKTSISSLRQDSLVHLDTVCTCKRQSSPSGMFLPPWWGVRLPGADGFE